MFLKLTYSTNMHGGSTTCPALFRALVIEKWTKTLVLKEARIYVEQD